MRRSPLRPPRSWLNTRLAAPSLSCPQLPVPATEVTWSCRPEGSFPSSRSGSSTAQLRRTAEGRSRSTGWRLPRPPFLGRSSDAPAGGLARVANASLRQVRRRRRDRPGLTATAAWPLSRQSRAPYGSGHRIWWPAVSAELKPRLWGGGGAATEAAAQGDHRGGQDEQASNDSRDPRPGGRLGSSRGGLGAGRGRGRRRRRRGGGGRRLTVGQAELDQLGAQAIEAWYQPPVVVVVSRTGWPAGVKVTGPPAAYGQRCWRTLSVPPAGSGKVQVMA